MMQTTAVRLLAVTLAAYALAGPAGGSARAGFISEFTGNTQMTAPGNDKGVVSFAVYDNSKGDFLSSLGLSASAVSNLTGSGAVDLNANYIYLYQVVNTAATNPVVDAFKVMNPDAFTSAGYFTNRVFTDGAGAVSATNPGLGTNPSGDDGLDGNPSNKNQTVSGTQRLAASINPSATDLGNGGDGNGFVTFFFTPPLLGGVGVIPAQKTSTIVILTSRYAPQYAEGGIQDGTRSDGDIPTAVTPEPGSLVLWGVGGVGLFGLYLRRRRAMKAQALAS